MKVATSTSELAAESVAGWMVLSTSRQLWHSPSPDARKPVNRGGGMSGLQPYKSSSNPKIGPYEEVNQLLRIVGWRSEEAGTTNRSDGTSGNRGRKQVIVVRGEEQG